MEYIISKPKLPNNLAEMESYHWFNIWSKKNWPYNELLQGDILYFFNTVNQRLEWKTKVSMVSRNFYEHKNELWNKYGEFMERKYFDLKSEAVYFLYYKIEVLEKLDIPKPVYNFKRLGWEEMDTENLTQWFNSTVVLDNTTIDDNVNINNKSTYEVLIELNKKMLNVSPERVNRLISTTLRKDTEFVNLLKKTANFKCQYPDCGHQIKTKKGDFYIEVAHIKPVNQGGQSILGNVLVLCPNHHKEFDYGDLNIKIQNNNQLSGSLNGKDFMIKLDHKA